MKRDLDQRVSNNEENLKIFFHSPKNNKQRTTSFSPDQNQGQDSGLFNNFPRNLPPTQHENRKAKSRLFTQGDIQTRKLSLVRVQEEKR